MNKQMLDLDQEVKSLKESQQAFKEYKVGRVPFVLYFYCNFSIGYIVAATMLRVQKSLTCYSSMGPNQIQVLVECDSRLSQQKILGFFMSSSSLQKHDIACHMTSQKLLLFRVTNWND